MRPTLDATYQSRDLRRLNVERWALRYWTVRAFVAALVVFALSDMLGAALFLWYLCGDTCGDRYGL